MGLLHLCTDTQDPPDPKSTSGLECSWSRCFTGCVNTTQEPSPCVHGKSNCEGTQHHNCAAEWEFAQYKKENPDGVPGDCSYDSEGKKYCIDCHPHSALAVTKPDEAEEEDIIEVEDDGEVEEEDVIEVKDDDDGADRYVLSLSLLAYCYPQCFTHS